MCARRVDEGLRRPGGGWAEGRSAEDWVDFDFFGHQIVAHLDRERAPGTHHTAVYGHDVPVPHFGVVLAWADWHRLAEGLRETGTEFIVSLGIRFAAKVGEQATMLYPGEIFKR